MQGYQRPTLKLVWPEDSEFHGLEVRAKRLSIGALLGLAELERGINADNGIERTERLVKRVAKMLLSWNLLDGDGQPVPATEDGVKANADQQLLNEIIAATATKIAGVTPPLPQPSTDGEQSPEADIPMEPLSPNLPTSPTPD